MSTHRLGNEYLEIKVADAGAELCSIYDKRESREVLWQADPKYWKRHAPVLFPNVGKHFRGQYEYKGTSYKTDQHGFARDRKFRCISKTQDQIVHRLEDDEETRKVFPFSFTLEITHTLRENRVQVGWCVENRGTDEMYFTIGGHPAFNVPAVPGTKRSAYKLLFDEKERLEYTLLDLETGTALPEQTKVLELENSACGITDDMFDKDALIFDRSQIEWTAIGYPDGSPYVGMECKGFPNFGIWSVPGAPFVCLEPWAGRCDDFGFEDDISKKPGIIRVVPEGIYKKSYDIIVY